MNWRSGRKPEQAARFAAEDPASCDRIRAPMVYPDESPSGDRPNPIDDFEKPSSLQSETWSDGCPSKHESSSVFMRSLKRFSPMNSLICRPIISIGFLPAKAALAALA